MDADLDPLSREQLVAERVELRNTARARRDSSMHGLCWQHPGLWNLLPEKSAVRPVVPEGPVFLRGCLRYRQLPDEQLADASRMSGEFSGRDSR